MKANARIEVNPTTPGDTWQTMAEFVNIGAAYEAVNAIQYGPMVARVRIMVRYNNTWICDYNRPAQNIRAEEKAPQTTWNHDGVAFHLVEN